MSWELLEENKSVPLKKYRITFEGETYEYYLHIHEAGFSEWLNSILDRLERAERKK